MNRAFHIGGLIWFFSVFLVLSTGSDPLIPAIAGAALLVLCIFIGKLPLWAYAASTAFCACMCGVMLHHAAAVAPQERYDGTAQTLRGTVVECEDYAASASVTLLTAPDLPKGLCNLRVRFSVPDALDVRVGDVVKCTGNLSRTSDRPMALLAQNLGFTGYLSGGFERLPESDTRFWVLLSRYRQRVFENLTGLLPGMEGSVLGGMVVGKTEQISPEIRYSYSRTGISHLLAVSGLHLAILAGLLEAFLAAFGCSRRARGLTVLFCVLAFMGLAGFSPSVMRAGIMVLLCRCAGFFGRDPDSLNSLGLAVILLLIWNPYAVFSLSLQLSYFATMGIAAFLHPLTDWCCGKMFRCPAYRLAEESRVKFALLQAVCTTLSASLLTLPILCWNFGQVSIVSPVVNLLILPLAPFALGCGLIAGFLASFPPLYPLARLLGLPAGIAVRWINRISDTWAALPFSAVPVRDGYLVLWMAGALLLGILLWAARSPKTLKRYAAALMGVALLAGACSHAVLWGDALEIAVDKNGDSIALAYGKQAAVIGAPKSVWAARNLKTFLLDRGVEQISLFVLQKDDDLYGNPANLLIEAFPVETACGLDAVYGFDATLFGAVRVQADGQSARHLSFEAGGLRFVKAFEQQPFAADVLINARNEIILAPGVELAENSRYFNSTVITVKRTERK